MCEIALFYYTCLLIFYFFFAITVLQHGRGEEIIVTMFTIEESLSTKSKSFEVNDKVKKFKFFLVFKFSLKRSSSLPQRMIMIH